MRIASPEDGKTTGDGSNVALFIRVPKDLAKHFPKKDTDKSPPHITFLFVGPVPAEREEEFLEVCNQTLRNYGPIKVTMMGYEEFQNQKGQTIPHVAIGFDRDVAAIRRRLRSALMAEGFEVSDSFLGYKPHSTLAYLETGEEYDGPVPTGTFEVSEIEIWNLPRMKSISLAPIPQKRATAVDVVTVMTSCPAEAAYEIAKKPVEERLASCVKVSQPVQGFYWWKGEVRSGKEVVVLYTTTRDRVILLIDLIRSLHPYELPAVLVYTPDQGMLDSNYFDWVFGETHHNPFVEDARMERTSISIRKLSMSVTAFNKFNPNELIGQAINLFEDDRYGTGDEGEDIAAKLRDLAHRAFTVWNRRER